MTNNNRELLSLEDAHSEAIAVGRMSELVMDAAKKVVEAQIETVDTEDDREKLRQQLQAMHVKDKKNEIQAASDYFDYLKENDNEGYRLFIDFHGQVDGLEKMVGKEETVRLLTKVKEQQAIVFLGYISKIDELKGTITIGTSALLGEALERLSKDPSNSQLPIGVFGQIYSVGLAQIRVFKHFNVKENT